MTSPRPNPNLRIDPSRTDARSFAACDNAEPRLFIEASLRTEAGERILSFLVEAQLPDGTRGQVRGSEFFAAMMDHFGDVNVDVIEGQREVTNPDWTANLDAFNRITGTTHATEADAATLVPTGKYATRRGYRRATVVRANPSGARGNYSDVLVQFRR